MFKAHWEHKLTSQTLAQDCMMTHPALLLTVHHSMETITTHHPTVLSSTLEFVVTTGTHRRLVLLSTICLSTPSLSSPTSSAPMLASALPMLMVLASMLAVTWVSLLW